LANENHRKGEDRQCLVQPNRNWETGKLRNQGATAMRMRNVIKRYGVKNSYMQPFLDTRESKM